MAGRRTRVAFATVGLLAILLGAAGLLLHHRPPAASPGQAAPLSPPRPPPPPWTAPELRDLLETVSTAAAEGLRPSDYDRDTLREAVERGQVRRAIDAIADRAAASLAHDFAAGRVRNRHRFNWYIDYAGPAPAELAAQILAARTQGRLQGWLHGLLPAGAEYRALRDALAATDEASWRDRIRANMERWRWLPRDFGDGDQLYVNLPTYRLEVVEGGRTVATYKAVIGATDMPTPVLSAPVRQVIANPDWIVPRSIVEKSHLRPGSSSRYIFSTRPDGTLRVRQKPGPGNALGRVKIEFPNRLAIYFHDTPSKSLFGASTRAFSHGCVRVQNIETLAASIVARPDRFATALAGVQTRGFATARPWQATIVYLTLVPQADGTIADVGDPYRMDDALAAALDGRKPRVPPPAPLAPPVVKPPTRAPAAPVDPDDVLLNASAGNAATADGR